MVRKFKIIEIQGHYLTDDHSFRLEASFVWSMYRRCRLASVGLWTLDWKFSSLGGTVRSFANWYWWI